jgi:hypothetical protein
VMEKFLVKKWQTVSRLLGEFDCVAWLTSTEWGQLVAELKCDYGSVIAAQPDKQNFTEIRIDTNLILRNAGTEDQGVVNEMNVQSLGPLKLAALEWRKAQLQTGNKVLAAPKPEGGYITPEDIKGAELPEDLQPE